MLSQPLTSLSQIFRFLLSVLLVLGSIAMLNQAMANQCETSACPKGYTYNAAKKSCQSRSGLGYRSHTPPRCSAGYTIDLKRGICRKRNCIDCEKPACRPRETYRKGLCHSRSGLGYKSHYRPNCGSGWHLVVARGVCRKNICSTFRPLPRPLPTGPIFKLKPDLVVVSMSAVNYGKYCKRGTPITVFKVIIKNVGTVVASGNSGRTKLRVYDRHYPNWSTSISIGNVNAGQSKTFYLPLQYLSLAPAHMTNTTPHPFVAVVDSTNQVAERNEGNNASAVRLLGAPAACLK